MILKRKPPGYWSEKRIISELEGIIKNLGYFPSGIQLKEMGRGDLKAAINGRGGLLKFRMIYKNKRNRNERFVGYLEEWNQSPPTS